jgi:hypothetical protein
MMRAIKCTQIITDIQERNLGEILLKWKSVCHRIVQKEEAMLYKLQVLLMEESRELRALTQLSN